MKHHERDHIGTIATGHASRIRKLHLGCFDRPVYGWINTDITPHLFVAKVPFLATAMHKLGRMNDIRFRQHKQGIFKKLRYLNATKPFPFASSSLDFVYSSHMLEKYIFRVISSRGY